MKESQIQQSIFEWAAHDPICKDYLFAIPNGGSRNVIEARNLKRQGLRKGVSDMMLAYPTKDAHGLWIELKRDRKSKLTCEQTNWLERMNGVGYLAKVAYGFDESLDIIRNYLEE